MTRKERSDIAQQIAYVRDGNQTAAQAILAIERLIGDDGEYATLDSVLGRGRNGTEKAADLCAHGNRGACSECEASGVDGVNLGEEIE